MPCSSKWRWVSRIERALDNLGYQRHNGRTVINLAPADLRKEAANFDLPIAAGLPVATGQLLPEQLLGFTLMGELVLDGNVRPIKGALSMAMAAAKWASANFPTRLQCRRSRRRQASRGLT
jgi:magnesium chelatase family protein